MSCVHISPPLGASLPYLTPLDLSMVALPVYIPTNSVGGFLLLHISPAFVVCGFLMMAMLTALR